MTVTATLGIPDPTKGYIPPAFTSSFDDARGVVNCTQLVTDYVFGSSASGSSPVIPITNATDLATYFNPLADVSQNTVEVLNYERYTPSFSTAANFVFATDHLSLTAALEAGGNADCVTINTNASTTNGTVLNFASTTGVQDGQMISIISNAGINYTRVVSHDSTTVTVSNNLTVGSGVAVTFLPVFVCSGTVAGSNVSTITFSSVPTGVAVGSFYMNVTSGTYAIRRVVSKTSTTVTLDGTVTVANSDLIYFQPPVVSGQFWTKAGFQPGKNNAHFIAMELTAKIPGNTKPGAWPAFWLYSRSSEGLGFDASEIDVFEYNICATANAGAYSGNNHGGLYQREEYAITKGVSSKWDAFGFYRPTGVDYSLTTHKWQFLWAKDRIWRFIDQSSIVSSVFPWSSNCSAQMGVNLGAGSLLPAYQQVQLFPFTTAQFPFSLDVYELKIWQG